ncbi:MAG TPA: hypothetical protein VKB86_11485 [Pyrinomonadaceae bacterium]|nr:hypothetical protein [Pyrinomonadaceae bacterium]
MSDQALDSAQLRTVGMQRLRSGEYPEAIARDLAKQGLPTAELESLFRDAASKQRRSGMFRIIAGAVLLLITAIIVWGIREAGYTVYGPGLLIGLFVAANGILKIKNSGEIARAIPATGR